MEMADLILYVKQMEKYLTIAAKKTLKVCI